MAGENDSASAFSFKIYSSSRSAVVAARERGENMAHLKCTQESSAYIGEGGLATPGGRWTVCGLGGIGSLLVVLQ